MADRRMLWKVTSLSRKVNNLSMKAAILWTWAIPHFDPEGYIEAEADYLKAVVVPKRKEIKEKEIPGLVQEIIDVGLWQPYSYDGIMVAKEIKFHDYQTIARKEDGSPRDEKPSTYLGKLKQWEPQGEHKGTHVEPVTNINKVNINKVKEDGKESCPSQDSLNIDFDWKEKKFVNITADDKTRWNEAYPAVNVEVEIRAATEWVLANPEKRKKKWRSFLTRWFARTQERGGTKNGPGTDKKTYDPVDRKIREAEERLRGGSC